MSRKSWVIWGLFPLDQLCYMFSQSASPAVTLPSCTCFLPEDLKTEHLLFTCIGLTHNHTLILFMLFVLEAEDMLIEVTLWHQEEESSLSLLSGKLAHFWRHTITLRTLKTIEVLRNLFFSPLCLIDHMISNNVMVLCFGWAQSFIPIQFHPWWSLVQSTLF